MSVKFELVDDKPFYRMYVQERAYLKTGRVKRLQKNLLFQDERTALDQERFWIRQLSQEKAKLESQGLSFSEILDRFEVAAKTGMIGRKLESTTLRDHLSRINRFCDLWREIPAENLNRGDGREIIRMAKSQGAKVSVLRSLKTSVNMVFDWGIEEKLITGMNKSPVFGLHIEEPDDEEKIPPILTLEQVKKLLYEAKIQRHTWYPVWAFAVLTGMRSGELFALRWDAVDLENNFIRVHQSYSKRSRRHKGTKAGYWRNIPISGQLMRLLKELQVLTGNGEYVLPRVNGWIDGYAAKNLRMFLKGIGIDPKIGSKHVVFHTLRACFATHLLASGAEPTKVMRIGGWKDFKTFQIYTRLAGIDVQGVTDNYKVLPADTGPNPTTGKRMLATDAAIFNHVEDMYDLAV